MNDLEQKGEEADDIALDPEYCHDKDKPRSTMEQYVSLVGAEVATNLEGIARARLEKPPRQYQSDAVVHQAYMQATTGGGDCGDDVDANNDPAGPGPAGVAAYFEPIPWNVQTVEDMQNI